MEIVSYIEGTAIFAVPLLTIRPDAGLPMVPVINDLGDFFQFQNAGVGQNNLPAFQGGTLLSGGETIAINHFEINEQAMVVLCNKTEHADTFFETVYRRLQERFKFRAVDVVPRGYKSVLVSQMSFDIERPLQQWKGLGKFATELLKERNLQEDISPIGVKMICATGGKTELATQITIERRFGPDAAPNRTFSSAPFSTADHIRFLQKYEETFAGT